ncbi:hypothetical protein M3J09_009593 [Ascochyta lentis]
MQHRPIFDVDIEPRDPQRILGECRTSAECLVVHRLTRLQQIQLGCLRDRRPGPSFSARHSLTRHHTNFFRDPVSL